MTTSDWASDVLHFWFDEIGPTGWFERADATDDAITKRFRALWSDLRAKVPAEALLRPDAALAAIITLDQFPRNMFRGTAEAFATDPLALAIARNALANGFDTAVPKERRTFFYMPFMHSEALDDQERCIELFSDYEEQMPYAIEHRDIIARYGRFPHRNRALGRQSSEEELAFLSNHAGFGQ
ncbi:MAG TPA: DUF924 family protein [Rhizobiaceae bacterium]|nr:DUF924 family protein [Rhizobiaceae bacterium]